MIQGFIPHTFGTLTKNQTAGLKKYTPKPLPEKMVMLFLPNGLILPTTERRLSVIL